MGTLSQSVLWAAPFHRVSTLWFVDFTLARRDGIFKAGYLNMHLPANLCPSHFQEEVRVLVRNLGYSTTIAVLALSLGGCATVGTYISPQSGPTASLQVSAVSGVAIGAEPEAGGCDAKRFVASREDRFGNITLLPASKPVWLGLSSTNGLWRCDAAIEFTPEPGARYSVAFAITPIGDSQCVISLKQRLSSGDEVPVAGVKRAKRNPLCS